MTFTSWCHSQREHCVRKTRLTARHIKGTGHHLLEWKPVLLLLVFHGTPEEIPDKTVNRIRNQEMLMNWTPVAVCHDRLYIILKTNQLQHNWSTWGIQFYSHADQNIQAVQPNQTNLIILLRSIRNNWLISLIKIHSTWEGRQKAARGKVNIRKVREAAESIENVAIYIWSFDLKSRLAWHSFSYSLASLETNRWNLSFPNSNAFHVHAQCRNTGLAKKQ